MIIYFVRHGKDNKNYRGGWSEQPLIKEGIKQVQQLASYLDKRKDTIKIDKIISSDLKRARQTAKIINNRLNVTIEYTEKLREMNNGKLAGMLNSSANKKYPGIYYNTLELDEKYPEGESPIEFYNRVVKDFEILVKENEKIENLMFVTHSGVINIIYKYINNMEWSNKIKSIEIENASIFRLIVNQNKRYFDMQNFKNFN